jgi:DNA-binding transcriptional ArsR family regulator
VRVAWRPPCGGVASFHRSIPDIAAARRGGAGPTLREELEQLAGQPAEALGLAFLRPLHDHGGTVDPGVLRDPAVRAEVLRKAAAIGGSAELARLIFDDPRALADRLRRFLAAYWEAGFGATYERLEPRLQQSAARARASIRRDDVLELLGGLSPKLTADAGRRELRRELPHHHRVELSAERPLVLVPSAHVWPHVRIGCDAPLLPTLIYPAASVAPDTRPPRPSRELVGALRALGDETRLRILHLLVERPRSTQELAPLVSLSQAGVSKHLRALADAGLVERRREGYYVLYRVNDTRLADLGPALGDYLD